MSLRGVVCVDSLAGCWKQDERAFLFKICGDLENRWSVRSWDNKIWQRKHRYTWISFLHSAKNFSGHISISRAVGVCVERSVQSFQTWYKPQVVHGWLSWRQQSRICLFCWSTGNVFIAYVARSMFLVSHMDLDSHFFHRMPYAFG